MEKQIIIEGTYQIIRELGSGSGGTVFLAYHNRLEKNVVLKKIKSGAQKLLDIRAETDILKNLHHPYLPQVFDFVQTVDENGADVVYTVMDFIPGKSFEDLLNDGMQFTPTQVAKYTRQLCEAVEYLHSRKPPILHCDIKPANVMLTPDDNICLIDFNISGDKDNLEVIAFTRGYASPEQWIAAQANAKRKLSEAHNANSAADSRDGSSFDHNNADETALLDGDETELLNENETELLDENETALLDENETELLPENHANESQKKVTDFQASREAKKEANVNVARIDQRSDIFSIGATAYRLLVGKKPDADYNKQIPVSKLNIKVSEGLAFVIDKAMRLDPKDRFQTATEMLKAMGSLGKKDKRYKRLVIKEAIFCTIFIILAAASTVTAYNGYYLMRSDRASEYYEKALDMYEQQQYKEGVEYIVNSALEDETLYDNVTLGNLYYLAAECCFEMNEYERASEYYDIALEHDASNVDYYCDYAISLSRLGKVEEASKVIDAAVKNNVRSDRISLMKAELLAALGSIDEADENYRACIDETDDVYLMARAYIMNSDLYINADGYEENISYVEKNLSVLEAARKKVGDSFLPIVLERLVSAYRDAAALKDDDSYIDPAIEASLQLLDIGWDTFTNYMNLAAMYDQLGRYDSSKKTYEDILEKFGNNYLVYKNLAFIELEVQSAKSADARDYGSFVDYYQKAVDLYEKSTEQHDTDTDMQLLKESYKTVVDGGWLK